MEDGDLNHEQKDEPKAQQQGADVDFSSNSSNSK